MTRDSKPEGYVFGRPREYDPKDMAEKILAWAELPDSTNLCGFSAFHMIPPSRVSTLAKQNDDFRRAFELAKSILADRREKYLSQELLHVKAYDLNATTYDFYLKEEKMEMAKHQASLSAESEGKNTQVIVKVQNDGLGSGISVSAEELPTCNNKSSK